MLIDEIVNFIERSPQAIARLFARHDIQAAPTPKNVGNAITVLRRPFVDDLLDLMHLSEQSGFNDDSGQPVTFGRVVDGLARISLGASNVANDVKGQPRLLARNNGYQAFGPGIYDPMYDDYQTDRVFGINRTLFLILAAVVIIAGIMYTKK